MANVNSAKTARPPRLIYSLLEGRALLEAAMLPMLLPVLNGTPRGDGHPVMLVPGFTAGDATMIGLKTFLRSRGYHVETWGLGRNVGFNRKFAQVIEQKVRHLHHRHRRKVSLVGWSLGGVFAFYIAHVAPECVRTAISLGSPLRLDPDIQPPPGVKAMYRAVAHPMGPVSHQARSRSRSMRAPPPVPSTCIYSESDGFVPPSQATLEGDPSNHENIRVASSHMGLGFNRRVLWIVADRLAQPEDGWQPYAG